MGLDGVSMGPYPGFLIKFSMRKVIFRALNPDAAKLMFGISGEYVYNGKTYSNTKKVLSLTATSGDKKTQVPATYNWPGNPEIEVSENDPLFEFLINHPQNASSPMNSKLDPAYLRKQPLIRFETYDPQAVMQSRIEKAGIAKKAMVFVDSLAVMKNGGLDVLERDAFDTIAFGVSQKVLPNDYEKYSILQEKVLEDPQAIMDLSKNSEKQEALMLLQRGSELNVFKKSGFAWMLGQDDKLNFNKKTWIAKITNDESIKNQLKTAIDLAEQKRNK